MTGYIHGEVNKFEKNIANVPEILGRLIVGLVTIFDREEDRTGGISLRDVDSLLSQLYKKPQTVRRRDYYRKFIDNNRCFLENFARKQNLQTVRRENCE